MANKKIGYLPAVKDGTELPDDPATSPEIPDAPDNSDTTEPPAIEPPVDETPSEPAEKPDTGYYNVSADPVYTEHIRKLRDSDPASATLTFNPLFQTMIENTAYLKKNQDGLKDETDGLKEEQAAIKDKLEELETNPPVVTPPSGGGSGGGDTGSGGDIIAPPEGFKVVSAVPTVKGQLVANGEELSPSFDGYNEEELVIGGTLSATEAGKYTVTFKPQPGYIWSDGTFAEKTVEWEILEDYEFSLVSSKPVVAAGIVDATVTINTASNGRIFVMSEDEGVATCDYDNVDKTKTFKVKGTGNGTTNIVVTQEASGDIPEQTAKLEMHSVKLSTKLSENTPDGIAAAAYLGIAPNLWKIGDLTAPIPMNGPFRNVEIDGDYCARLIGFNHNKKLEGERSMHFQIPTLADGTDCCFGAEVGSGIYYNKQYNPDDPEMVKYSDYYSNNSLSWGGWAHSDIRKDMNDAFEEIIPEEWNNVIKPCIKYTDNTCGMFITWNDYALPESPPPFNIPTPGTITATRDKFWLLAVKEFRAPELWDETAKREINPKEIEYQELYEHYENGNIVSKRLFTDIDKWASCWLRTMDYAQNGVIMYLHAPTQGTTADAVLEWESKSTSILLNDAWAATNLSVAPCFAIGGYFPDEGNEPTPLPDEIDVSPKPQAPETGAA